MKCPCNTECTDCVPGFQKIIDLKNAGLIIYRRTTETKDVNKNTGIVDYAVNTTEDIYILHNTKDTDISSADYWPEIGNNTINCPRCRKLLEHAQNILKKGPTISGNDVTGICDHCKMKDKPCFKCRQVVKRFVPGKPDQTDIKKERVKHWLTKIGYLLQDINKITDEKKRAHSDTHIDQICHDRRRTARKPDEEQLVQPLELDLAAISQPHINSQLNEKKKEKKPVAHFPQLEKLETPLMFKDSLERVVPATPDLFRHDESFGDRSNFNVPRILKPEKKNLASKYTASTAQINSSETNSDVKSFVSFEQLFKDTISGSFTQQGAKTSRQITQSDEIISFKLPETKHVISEKNEEKPTRRKRARSVQPLEEKKENLLHTKTEESERTDLLRKYHSAETLLIKIHGITEYNLKQANRIIFPRQQSNIPTKQKSSSELIKDTKDKLTRAKEEKKLKKIFYEQTGKQREDKETAWKMSEKAINRQESAVDDRQNARQEDKRSLKPDEKDDFRAEHEAHKTGKDSQKSPKDNTDIIEEKTETSEKDTQTAYEKSGYKSEKGAQKVSQHAENAVKVGYKYEKGIQKAPKSDTDDYTSEKSKNNTTKDPQATTYGSTHEKGAKKSTKDAQKGKDGYKSENEAQEARKAVNGSYKFEKGFQKNAEDGYKSEKGTKKYTKDAQVAKKDADKFHKDAQTTLKDAQKPEKDGYAFEKGAKKSTKDTHIAEKDAQKFEKGAQTTSKDAQKAAYAFEKGVKQSTKDAHITKKDGHKYERGHQNTSKDTQKDEKDVYAIEKGTKKSTKHSQKAENDGYTSERGAKKSTKDTHIADKDAHKFEKGAQTTSKDAQKAAYAFEKGVKKLTKDARLGEKDAVENEKDAQKTSRGTQKAERRESGYTAEKGGKEPKKDAQIAVKNTHQFKKGAQKTPTDVQKAKIETELSSQKEEKHTQKTDLRGQKTTKDFLKSLKDAQKDMTPKSPKVAHKLQKEDQNSDIHTKKISMEAADRGFQNQLGLKLKQKTQALEKKTKTELLSDELKKNKDQEPKLKAEKEKGEVIKKKLEGDQNTEVQANKIAMKAADLGFENQLGFKLKQKTQALGKKTKTELPSLELRKMKDQEPKLKAEKEKVEVIKTKLESDQNTEIRANKIAMAAADLGFEKQIGYKLKQKTQALEKKSKKELPTSELKKMKDQEHRLNTEKNKVEAIKNKLEGEIKLDTRLGAQPILHDLLDKKSIKINQSVADDLILKLVQIKQSTWDGVRLKDIPIKPIKDMRLPDKESKVHQHRLMVYPPHSDASLLWTDNSENDQIKEPQITDIIIGPQICKITPRKLHDDSEIMPPLLTLDKKPEITQTPETIETEELIKPSENEKQETVVSTEPPKTKEAMKQRPLLSPGTIAAGATTKGYVRYTLSDRKFIDNGWTLLPTEKVVRKMNVYRMRPAHPEFDWFEHNKNKRLMEYDTGEKLAEFDDSGRGRWFYRNGRMALDYYDAEELNAGQRFVIYSNGEPDERGRSRPYTLLATFDFLGNGIVFDHRGKIRLKYNQTEGVVLDRSIGPVSHWKWHTLNDPPVLQQVMIDTQIAHKDPKIMKMGGPSDNKPRKDNEEMLAIEFDNFIKEKSKKLSQTFKPFQIKMKALKINEHFSLRVLDQATVYLLYRDGTTNLKLNIGMVLDQKEIVDTDTAEVGEVSSSMEKLPARTESLAGLQRSVAHAQHYDWKRTERERKMHPAEPNASVDKLVAGVSRPLRPPQRSVLTQSTSATSTECKCSRKPTSTSVYYDTRFY